MEKEVVKEKQVSYVPVGDIVFKIFDYYGSVVYSGNDYRKAMNKVRSLSGLSDLSAFDKNNKYLGTLWATKIPGINFFMIKIDKLMPN